MKKNIKALIFDFGNVIIDIDPNLTYQAFAKYCYTSPENVIEKFNENEIFKRYEKGHFNDEEFREIVRQTLGFPINDNEIDIAWNKLLLDLPFERIELINKLKNKYEIFLLSNTNSMHIKECKSRISKKYNIKDFFNIFDKAFLSYEMGMWKPEKEIYLKVLDEINFKPEEVLFLDDNEKNILAASELGINTVLITEENGILEVFENESL